MSGSEVRTASRNAVSCNHRRALRLVAVLGVLTVVVFLLVGTDPNRGFVQDVDDGFLDLMVSARTGPLVWVAKALAFAGSVWVNWPIRVVVMVLLAVAVAALMVVGAPRAVVADARTQHSDTDRDDHQSGGKRQPW